MMIAVIYPGEMIIAIVTAIILLAISASRVDTAIVLFAGGFVAWALCEYLVHRFVLHDLVHTGHRLHHTSPDEPVLVIFWQIWACFAVVYFIAGGVFLAGTLIAHAWYLFVHHAAHGQDKVPARLLLHHANHHRLATRNYGVSATFWDRVFGTMLR
jgi:sterol desaturase/sphingolipid hydroxylase (fatty acid hydroxylase superfamily)